MGCCFHTFAPMEEKRQQIIERSFELFYRYGIKSVSMDDIAREMGMSKKTLYQYINDKKELVVEVVLYMRTVMEEMVSVFSDTSLNAVEQHFAYWDRLDRRFANCKPTFLYDLRKYYPAILKEINNWKKTTFYNIHYLNMEQGKKEGFYRTDIDAAIISKIMVGYHLFIFDPINELFSDAELTEKKTFEETFKYHFYGICTPTGIEEVLKVANQSHRITQ